MKKILIFLFVFLTYGFSFVAPYPQCDSNYANFELKSNTMTYSKSSYCRNNVNNYGGVYDNSCDSNKSFSYYYSDFIGCNSNPESGQCTNDLITEDGLYKISCINGYYDTTATELAKNGVFDDNGNIACYNGYRNVDGSCYVDTGDGYYDNEGNLNCDNGITTDNETCTPLPEGQNPDGTCQDGYTKVIINIDEPAVCQPTSTGGDTGSGGTGGDTGTDTPDSGSGGSTGGDTGTDNPDSGSGGSTGGDTGTDTGDTGSGGGTGGGVSGGDGDTTNEDNTDNTDNDIPQDSVENNSNCSDPNLTLQEKMLCEINEGTKKINNEADPSQSLNNLLKDLRDNNQKDNTAINTNIKDIESLTKDVKEVNLQQLSKLQAINTSIVSVAGSISQQNSATASTIDNPINDVDTQIDTMTSEFTTFINNQTQSLNDLQTKVTETTETLKNGFSFNNLAKASVTSCPLAFTLDLSSLNVSSIDITLDICEYTSMLYPYMYPFFYIILSLGVIYLSISLIKVF